MVASVGGVSLTGPTLLSAANRLIRLNAQAGIDDVIVLMGAVGDRYPAGLHQAKNVILVGLSALPARVKGFAKQDRGAGYHRRGHGSAGHFFESVIQIGAGDQRAGASMSRPVLRCVKLAIASTAVVLSRAPDTQLTAPKFPSQTAPTLTTCGLMAG